MPDCDHKGKARIKLSDGSYICESCGAPVAMQPELEMLRAMLAGALSGATDQDLKDASWEELKRVGDDLMGEFFPELQEKKS